MKSYTDISQSNTLSKILPLESADMYYTHGAVAPDIMIGSKQDYRCYTKCWSLAALLAVLNKSAYCVNEAGIIELSSIKATKWCVSILNCGKIENCYADNPIDACYEMILKLYELNMLWI